MYLKSPRGSGNDGSDQAAGVRFATRIIVAEWPFADEQLAYLAPPTDDHFYIEVLGGGDILPTDGPRLNLATV